MNDKFDELAKGLAQSVTRRGALKKFGLGLAGITLAALGLANTAEAAPGGCKQPGQSCHRDDDCSSGFGAADCFARSGTNWSQQAFLTASNFGGNSVGPSVVALSGDTLVVGAATESSSATDRKSTR